MSEMSSHHYFLVCLFIVSIITLAKSLQIYVDNSYLGSTSDGQELTPFKSLSDAINSVADSNTLQLASIQLTLGTGDATPYTFGTQSLSPGINTDFSIIGSSSTSLSDCEGFPSILLSSSSYFGLSESSASSSPSIESKFVLSGIKIFVDGSVSSSFAVFMVGGAYEQITLQSVCLIDTYDSAQSPNPLTFSFFMASRLNLMALSITTQGLLTFDIQKISQQLQIREIDAKFSQTIAWPQNRPMSYFTITEEATSTLETEVSDVSITCSSSPSASSYLTSFLSLDAAGTFSVSNLAISQCNALLASDFLTATASSSISMNGITIDACSFEITRPFEAAVSSMFFRFGGSQSYALSTITIKDSVFDFSSLDHSDYPSDMFYFTTQAGSPSITVNALSISSSQFLEGEAAIVNLDTDMPYDSLAISGISLLDSIIDTRYVVRTLVPGTIYTLPNVRWLNLDEYWVNNCTLKYSYLLAIIQRNSQIGMNITDKEYYNLQNWTITNSIFTVNSQNTADCFLTNNGAFLYMINITIHNNTFNGSSAIATKIDSGNMVLLNAVLSNNTQISSTFYTDIASANPDRVYLTNRSIGTPDGDLMRLCRITFWQNVTVTDNILTDSSGILNVAVPLLVLYNSTFSNNLLQSSDTRLLTVASYTALGLDAGYNAYVTDPTTESFLYSSFPLILQFLNRGTSGTAGVPEDQVHLYILEDVVISSCSLANQAGVIEITDLNEPSTGIHFYNVNASGFDDYPDADSSDETNVFTFLMHYDTISYFRIENSNFQGIRGTGTFMKIGTLLHDSTFIFRSNVIKDAHGRSVLEYQNQETTAIEISNSVFDDISANGTFFYISVFLMSGDLIIANNTFSNCHVSSSSETVNQLNMMQIQISQTASEMSISFTNCLFSSSTLTTTNDFVRNVFYNSFIFLSAAQIPLHFEQVSFDNIGVFYEDSLIRVSTNLVNFKDCSFSNILTFEGTGMISLAFEEANFTGCSFTNITGSSDKYGSLLYLSNSISQGLTSFQLVNSSFTNILSASASVLYVGQALMNIIVADCAFMNVLTTADAAVVFAKTQFEKFNISQITIDFNDTFTTLCFPDPYNTSLSTAPPFVQGSFLKATGIQLGSGATSPIIADVSLRSLDNLFGIFLNISQGPETALLLRNFTQKGGLSDRRLLSSSSASMGYGLLVVDSSWVELEGVTLSGFSLVDNSIISVSCLHDKPTNLTLSASSFSLITLTSTLRTLSALRIMASSSFCGHSIHISSTNFTQITSNTNGSVILNLQEPKSTSMAVVDSLVVNNCLFSENSASSGGAMYFASKAPNFTTIEIQNSQFTQNYASAQGGALWLNLPSLSLSDCLFTSNQALLSGGAIYTNIPLDLVQLEASNNTKFLTNSVVEQYGKDLASDPISLGVALNSDDLQSQMIQLDSTKSPVTLLNVSSFGLQAVRMDLTIYDVFGQVAIDNTSPKKIFMIVTSSFPTGMFTYLNCSSTGCSILPSDLQFAGKAGENVQLQISYESPLAELNYMLNVVLRVCLLGEINSTATGLCNVCPPAKYSLDLHDEHCKPCMHGAVCNGGSSITVLNGYWRANTTSSNVIACPDEATCLGGTTEMSCLTGYMGPLCQQCDNSLNYVRSSGGKCGLCPSSLARNLAALVGTSLLTALYLTIFIYVTISSNRSFYVNLILTGQRVPRAGPFFTSLTSYCQLLNILISLDNTLAASFGFGSFVGNPYEVVFFSSDCALISTGLKIFEAVQWRVVISTISPFGYWIFCSTFLLIARKFSKGDNKKGLKLVKVKQILGISFICMFILQQPSIIRGLIEFFNCQKLDPDSPATYMVNNLNIRCDSDEFVSYKMKAMIPFTIAWGAVIPVTAYCLLHYNRKKLRQETIRVILGSLVNEYKDRVYYWGVVLIILKEVLLLVANALNEDVDSRIIGVLLILVVYFYLLMSEKPQFNAKHYKIELYAVTALMLTAVFILLRRLADSQVIQIIALICLVFVNCAIGLAYLRIILKLLSSNKKGKFDKFVDKICCFAPAKLVKKTSRLEVNLRSTKIRSAKQMEEDNIKGEMKEAIEIDERPRKISDRISVDSKDIALVDDPKDEQYLRKSLQDFLVVENDQSVMNQSADHFFL